LIRLTSVPPGAVNLPKLAGEAAAAWPKIVTTNMLEAPVRVAFYFDQPADAPTQAAADALVAAHNPIVVATAASIAAAADLQTTQTFVANVAPTLADVVAALKALARLDGKG